jgi:hypothetical protein
MNNRPDIWRRLQDHETTPPQELSGRVLHAFRASTENGLHSLERLQQYTTPPPAFMQAAIRNSTIGSGPSRNGWSPPFRFFYGAVAACLMIVAGLVFYLAVVSPQKQTKDVARKTTTPASVLPARQDTTAPQSIAGDSSGMATAVTGDATDSTSTGSTAGNVTIRTNRPQALYIDHRSFPLVNNDLLVTFTSFRYPEIADHVSKADDQAMKVHLDQYTNIVISKQVIAMIKEMYQTRSNGKPTRRARKAKEKLEDWKKADEKHFDSTAFFNAADPIDLAEFIFK